MKLIDELLDQCIKAKINFEIICLDDCSKELYKLHNGVINSKFGVNYVELSENLGRSKIRNRMVSLARYDWLLFLDADSKIPNKKFIKNYVSLIDFPAVYVGGTVYSKKKPKSADKLLHWYYGKKREVNRISKRNQNPALFFHSNNFLIHHSIIKKYPFAVSLQGYGYEDLLLGKRLTEGNVHVKHISNPIRHTGIKSFDAFLDDQKNALRNLADLYTSSDPLETRLTTFRKTLSKSGLLGLFIRLIKRKEEGLVLNLRKHPNQLFRLDLLKLLYFEERLQIARKQGQFKSKPI